MSQSQTAQGDHFQFLHLIGVEVVFKNKRPKYPVKIKVIYGRDTRKSEEFGSGALLRWESDIHLSPTTDLEVVVKESHTVDWPGRGKKEYASVRFEATDIGANALVTKEDERKMISVTLTFASPDAAGGVVRKGAEEARGLLDKSPVLLEKLRGARKFVEFALELGKSISEIDPHAKAAFAIFDTLYKVAGPASLEIPANILEQKLKEQESLHKDASDLIEDLLQFLPFTEVVDPKSLTVEATKAIEEFLRLFEESCSSVIQYLSNGNILDKMLSALRPRVDDLKAAFERAKTTYDWCIKVHVWKMAIQQYKHVEDDLLKQLQLSSSVPAGKERYRTDKCCLTGTRAGVLEQVSQWADPASSLKLFWMNGVAGSGKSAIASTVARMFDGQRLLAGCFFCRRDDPDLRNTEKVIPSLAFHLSVWHQPYSTKLLSILQGDEKNKLAAKTVQEQFELLIKGPILALSSDQQIQSPRPLIIVIDALDECDDSSGKRFYLAQVLLQVSKVVPWLKLFVTSRPLPEFSQVFEGTLDSVKKLALTQAEDPTADITLYTDYRAKLIAQKKGLVPTWLSREQITSLTGKSRGLFIWTSTVFNFIEGRMDVNHAVEVVLSASQADSENPEAELDHLYRTVLQEAASNAHDLQLVKNIVGVISSTNENMPLTIDAMHELIPHISVAVITRVIDQLQAVLYKDDQLQNAIRACHPSFIDFMSKESRSVQFWIRPQEVNSGIATRCLQIMKEGLHFNICQLETSYQLNKVVAGLHDRIAKIPQHLIYSCLYWMSHVHAVDASQRDGLVEGIFRIDTSLYWLEMLSLLQELKKGIQMLSQASISFTSSELKASFLDLFRFVSAFHDPISISTPHLYISALAWIPSETFLARNVYATFTSQAPIRQGKSSYWPSALLTISEIGRVAAVAYSPDGMHIASGIVRGAICIRDAQTGTLRGLPTRAHDNSVASVAFSPDGKLVASGSYDQTVQIWDVQTGMPASEPLKGHTSYVRSVVFSPDGKYIVSGSDDKTIRIWDAETGTLVKRPLEGHIGYVLSVAFSPDGRHIVSGSSDETVQFWDAESGEAVGEQLRVEGYTGWISLAYSPDGTYIVSGSYDGTVRLWDVATVKPLREPFVGHTDSVDSVACSPDGKLVVSGSRDKAVRIWDVRTGKLVGKPLKGHTGWVTSVAFSHDGKHVVSGSDDRSIRVWDLETGNFGEETLKGRVTSVAFSSDGKYVASGSTENIVQLWDAGTGEPVKQPFEGHDGCVKAVAFSPSGKYLVSGSDDMTIRIWDVDTHTPVGEPITGHSGWVKSVDFSRDGKRIVSSSEDGTVRVWDVDTAKPVGGPLESHSSWVNSVAFSPDGKHVALGSDDSTVRIWDIDNSSLAGEALTGHAGPVLSVAYSPEGTHIASGSVDGTIRIWNVESGTHITIDNFISEIGSVAYSPDGRRLASCLNMYIQIWDAQSGSHVGVPYTGHTDWVTSVAYSLDGKRIVSGSDDGTIRIWETERTPVARVTDIDGVPPSSVPDDGWIRISKGELLLWVPVEYRKGIEDMCSLCIPPDAPGHPVRVDWSRLCHGTSWTDVKRK